MEKYIIYDIQLFDECQLFWTWPLADFLQAETPENLYRFRKCNERSIAAFDQDQLWFSPGYKMNDDFDALLHFDKERIKSELKTFIESEQFTAGLQSIGQGTDGFSVIGIYGCGKETVV